LNLLTFYLVTVGIFICLNGIQVLGFNMQFGMAGILNFAFIVLVAVGAYATAIASVSPAPNDGFTYYIGGFGWQFPWNVLFGVGCTLVFALILGGLALRRLRHDYLALTLVALGQGLQILVLDDPRLFNGNDGILNVPAPWADLSLVDFQFAFLAMSFVLLVVVYLIMARVTASPWGRALKAIREDEEAAASLGRSVWGRKLVAFLIGAGAAGLSGSLLAIYVGGWNAGAWATGENLILLAAVIVGGRGRHLGALVGTILLFGGIVEGTRFLPAVPGQMELIPSLRGIAIGLLVLGFLWWRPEGILSERKERFSPERDDQGNALRGSEPSRTGASS